MMVLTTLLALTLTQGAPEMRMMRNPDIHGDLVVFTYASDLWLADRRGGPARRLTTHPGTETLARFSPDGKWIAFTGQYDGDSDVYVMPVEGGQPRRLTFDPGGDAVTGWTPDGKNIAYVSGRGAEFTQRLWTVPFAGGMPVATDLKEVSLASYSPDGKKLAFTRKWSYGFNWRRYRGGTQGKISFWDFDKKAYSEIPSGREQSWYPMWCGNNVYYASDKNDQTVNLYSYDTTDGKVRQLTHFTDADVRNPNSDGNTIVYERNSYLETYDIKTGKVEKLDLPVLGDFTAIRPKFRQLGDQVQGIALAPSGKRIAIQARGEIFSVPAKNGETRNLTNTVGPREKDPQWSPDGKTIAYLGDATGEWQIYTVPQMGGTPTRILTHPQHHLDSFGLSPDGKLMSYMTTDHELVVLDPKSGQADSVVKDKYGIGAVDWSPDSKWIAYTRSGDNLFGAVYIYSVKDKKSTKVTDGYFRDDSVAFDLNGKYLYIISSRTFSPAPSTFEFMMNMAPAQKVYLLTLTKDIVNPFREKGDEEPGGTEPAKDEAKDASKDVKIDFDGLSARALPLPTPTGDYQGVIGLNNGILYIIDGTLYKLTVGEDEPQAVLRGLSRLSFNPARTSMAYQAMGQVGISDIRPGVDPRAGAVPLDGVAATVDPKAEYKQMFWEAWRYMRDHFYDPKMLGLDWFEIGRKYEKMVDYASNRNDLNIILGQMVGELGTGHAYVFGGEVSGGVGGPRVGMLGADFVVEGKAVKFGKIYRGLNFDEARRGPLGEPGVNVKEGEYLIAINGAPVNTEKSISEYLINKVNKEVTLTINEKPVKEGARDVIVRPVGDEGQLRYISWVEARREMVNKLSNGKIGYMHVPNTSVEGVVEFIKGYYSQSDKQAWIIDERYNGGGMIPTFFIEFLQRSFTSAATDRWGATVGFPNQALVGPKAMLINSYAGSGGDLFPWLFRQAKLGPLIGTRTWGGLVGIAGNANLVDGGGITAPQFGLFDPTAGKWIAENTGIDPDIEVDDRPDYIAQGKDMPIEKAVEYLLKELEQGKGRKPFVNPVYPVVKAGK